LRLHRGAPTGLGIALALSLLVPVSAAHGASPRIVGGAPVALGQAPWQVLVSIRNQELCGGSILNATTILTAAHCVDRGRTPADVRVVAGTVQLGQGGIDRRVTGITIHPSWDRTSYRNDIALVTLESPLPTTADISPIRLPDIDQPWPLAGTPASVFGWGSSQTNGSASEILQGADLVVLAGPDDPVCGGYGNLYDPVSQLCAGVIQGGVDACQGDSGGALVITTSAGPTVAGVVSTGQECGAARFPGLYTRVTTYLSWLQPLVSPQGMSPSVPQSVSARSPRAGRVRVTWQPPLANGGSPIIDYRVTVGRQTCRTSATTCIFTKLRRGTTLTARVEATNDIGTSPIASTRVQVR
jgi:trypsin